MTSGGEAAGFPQASAPGTDLARVFGPLDQRDADQIREVLQTIDSELAAFADELRQPVGGAGRAPRLAVYPGLAGPIQGEVYGGDRHDVLVFIAGLAPVAPSSDRWRVYGTIDVDPPPDDTYPGEAMWEALSLPEQSFAVPLDAVAGCWMWSGSSAGWRACDRRPPRRGGPQSTSRSDHSKCGWSPSQLAAGSLWRCGRYARPPGAGRWPPDQGPARSRPGPTASRTRRRCTSRRNRE